MALPGAEDPRHTVGCSDVEIGRRILVIPNDCDVLAVPRERKQFGRAGLFRKHEDSDASLPILSGNLQLCKSRREVVPLVLLRFPDNSGTGSRALWSEFSDVVAFLAILSRSHKRSGGAVEIAKPLSFKSEKLAEVCLESRAVARRVCRFVPANLQACQRYTYLRAEFVVSSLNSFNCSDQLFSQPREGRLFVIEG